MLKGTRGRVLLALGFVVLLPCLAGALACGRGAREAPASWYPLARGHRWRYRLSFEKDGKAGQTQVMIRNLPPRGKGAKAITPQQTIFGPHGTVLFVKADDSGVYQIGEAGSPGRPNLYSVPVYLLKAPLREGHPWRQRYRPVLLKSDRDVSVDVRVISRKSSVRVPAGDFDGCLEVLATGTSEPRPGEPVITVERRAWYARDVGMVKTVSTERSGKDVAKLTLELELHGASVPGGGAAPASAPGG